MITTVVTDLERRNDERGFFTIWVLGLCVIVFFIGGLSFDLWHGLSQRRQLTSMVDGAAVAGAAGIDVAAFQATPSVIRLDPALAEDRARQYMVRAQADNGIEVTAFDAVVVDNQVRVSAASRIDLSLTKILMPNRDIPIEVSSSADPACAGVGCAANEVAG